MGKVGGIPGIQSGSNFGSSVLPVDLQDLRSSNIDGCYYNFIYWDDRGFFPNYLHIRGAWGAWSWHIDRSCSPFLPLPVLCSVANSAVISYNWNTYVCSSFSKRLNQWVINTYSEKCILKCRNNAKRLATLSVLRLLPSLVGGQRRRVVKLWHYNLSPSFRKGELNSKLREWWSPHVLQKKAASSRLAQDVKSDSH